MNYILASSDSDDSDKEIRCKNNKCSNYYTYNWKGIHSHLRFDFDARNDNSCKEHNKKIIELFNEFYKDKRCIVHSHKGTIWIQIVSLKNFQHHDYYYTNIQDRYCNYINDNFPYLIILSYSGSGTVDIIKDLIIKINSNDYKINNGCYDVEIKNNL